MAACHLLRRQFTVVLLAVVVLALGSSCFAEEPMEPTEPTPTEPEEGPSNSTNQSSNLFTTPTTTSTHSIATSSSLYSEQWSTSSFTASVVSKNTENPPRNSQVLTTAVSTYGNGALVPTSAVSKPSTGNSLFIATSKTQGSVVMSSQASVLPKASAVGSTNALKTLHLSNSSSVVQRATSSAFLQTENAVSASQSSTIMPDTTKALPSPSSITSSSALQTKTFSSMDHSSTILSNMTYVVQGIITSTISPSSSVCIECTTVSCSTVVSNSTVFGVSPSPSLSRTQGTTFRTMTLSSNSSIAMEKTTNSSNILTPTTTGINMTRTSVIRTAPLSVIPTSSWNQSSASDFMAQTSTVSPSSAGLFSSVYSKQLNFTASSSVLPRTSSIVLTTPTTPPVHAPSAPPQDVQAYNTSSTSIRVTWRPPPSDTLNGVLTKYEVLVRKLVRSSASQSASQTSSPRVSSTYITASLSSGVRHTLSTISATGTNPSSSTIVPPTEPTEAPIEPTSPPESLVAPIDAGLNLSIIVSNLEKFTFYEVRVRAVTVRPGPYSAPVNVQTDEDVPNTCQNISLSSQNSTSVMVHWTRPLQTNGILLGYKIYYGLNGSRFSTKMVASNEEAYLLEGLLPFTLYIIRVMAFTRKGEGEPVSTSFKTLEAAPSAIRNLTGVAINSTAVNISWTRPEYPNGEIKYVVMMTTSSGEEFLQSVKIYQGRETYCIATGLKPVTRYLFSVSAMNVKHLWQSTVVDVAVITSAAEPSGPPLDIQTTVKNSTSILVQWQPPLPSLRNGLIKKYVVQYSSDKSTYLSKATQDNSTRLLLTSLSPYTMYYIKVQAVNLAGAGPFSEPVTNMTLEDAPSPPTNITARSVNATCVLVSWGKPVHLNGETISYELYYRLTSVNASQDSLIYDGESTIHVICGLHEYANYTFTLYASNVKFGYKSSPVLAMETTHPAAPSGPPQNTRAVTISSRSILVQWEPPKALDMNGIITRYLINMKRPDGAYESRTLNGTSNSWVFKGLRPYKVYVFTVQAVNLVGAGPRSPPISNTTYEEIPDAPIIDQVTNLSSTVLQIGWLVPLNPNGKLTEFAVCWELLDWSSKTCNVTDGTTRTFNIYGLEPYSLYNITIRAATSQGYGPFVSGLYRTMEGVPSKPQNLHAWNTSATSIFVTWKAPVKNNGILISYKVSYRPSQNSSVPDSADFGLSTNFTLRNLKAFTFYCVCVQATTSQGLGDKACGSFSTDEGVPGAVSSFSAQADSSSSIHLTWSAPSHPNGKIGYTLYYYSTINPELNDTIGFLSDHLSYYVNGLEPYTNYTFGITAYNLKKGLEGPARLVVAKTKPALPEGPPLNVRVVNSTDESLTISWDPPAKPNGPIKGYRLMINDVKTPNEKDYPEVDDKMYTIKSLKASHQYAIKIGSIPAWGVQTGPWTDKYIFTTQPSAPPALRPIKPPDKDMITSNEIVIELQKASNENGKINFYQVIVLEIATDEEGNPVQQDKNPDEYKPSDLLTYQEARKRKPDLVPYITAEFSAEDFHSYRIFRVGDAKNYSTTARRRRDTDGHYYNGPLEPGTYYSVFQRAAVTRDLYTSTGWLRPVSTAASSTAAKRKAGSSTNTGLVVGLCVTFILIIIFIVIVFTILWKKRRFDFGVMLDDESSYTGGRSLRLKKIRGSKRRTSSRGLMGSTDSLDNLDDINRRRQPIPVEDFPNHVRRMHIDGDIGFSEEYELVQPNDEEFTWHHSLHSANKYKNRYANIVAYDHSRVILTPIEGVAGSDYINANYIDGYNRSGAYIACQGPLPETFDDFWRMIWEQGTATVVMLTQLEERGRRKCDQYWPDRGTKNYGMIRVTASETSHMSYYILRTFILSHKQEEEEPRQVKQYHFTSWPDHGVPSHPAPLLSLVRTVTNANPASSGPIVVHCSAGVGRTGTYITLDAMLQKIEKEQTIDVFEFVKQMRTKRNIMVQTESQYVFIYDALNEAVSCGVTEFEAKKFGARLRELREVDPNTGRTYMEKEFLRLVKDERHPSTFRNANLGIDSSKNRYANILPYEKTRVHLKMRPGELGSDYINASYIDGYCRLNAFIATQAPVPNTFEDFWRMIWEQKSSVIVMLTREEEGGKVKCHRYWPSDGTRIFDNVLVELSEEVSYSDYVMRQFSVTHTEEKEVRIVRQYQYMDWPDIGLPESGVGVIDLIGQIEKWQQQSCNSMITVHCSGGVGRTGVFCAVSILIERVKAEGIIDVFQTVQSLRLQRPAMVQTIEQYEFSYSTLQEYLDSFDLYANFQ
ncbi:receptor-type tyrosine-protein phosphatase delta-like [Actinia tenebrosa]|uniref:Receptor-type tyrosine-protein phosphatase delta-like n=1 Tax=Actinia tenebrosa TaxID=6105 RepID=A0A6P8J0V6_ACTTE|nr:receptor-type tyrosine-protein phosphatase delta-like [Actinia tenebrosa]